MVLVEQMADGDGGPKPAGPIAAAMFQIHSFCDGPNGVVSGGDDAARARLAEDFIHEHAVLLRRGEDGVPDTDIFELPSRQ